MRSGVVASRYVWSAIAAIAMLTVTTQVATFAEATSITLLFVIAMVVVPWFANRSELIRRRIRDQWRHGQMPRRKVRSQSWKKRQVSVRATLIVTAICALFIASQSGNSTVSGMLVGLGCVAGGVLIGLDYEPRGFGVWRGKAISSAIGGILGALVFSLFAIVVRSVATLTFPDEWFWMSLGRLTLLWLSVGACGGILIGLWKASQPFRAMPSTHELVKVQSARLQFNANRKQGRESAPAPQIEAAARNRLTRKYDLYPAFVASILFHVTFASLHAGMFDMGSKLESEQGNPHTSELQIIASITKPEKELDLNPIQFEATDLPEEKETNLTPEPSEAAELTEEVATDQNPDRFEAPDLAEETKPELNAVFEETDDTELASTNDETVDATSNQNEEPIESIDEIGISGDPTARATERSNGTLGGRTDRSFEIPLEGQTVRLISTSSGTSTYPRVQQLRLRSDGKRVQLEFGNSPDPREMNRVELRASFLSVVFESSADRKRFARVALPFAQSDVTISDPVANDEARIVILSSNRGARSRNTPNPTRFRNATQFMRRSQTAPPVASRRSNDKRETTLSPGITGKNLLKNGDFESPRVGYGWTDMERGGGEFIWTITKDRVEMKAGFWDGVSERAAIRRKPTPKPPARNNAFGGSRSLTRSTGDQSVDMDFYAVMHQDFRTVPGTTYEVTLWYSHNPDGGNKSASGHVHISGRSRKSLLNKKITHNEKSTLADMKFKQFVGRFKADSTTSRLQIESLQRSIFGLVIDDVKVGTLLSD